MAPAEAFHLPGLQLPHNSDWGWGSPSVLLWGGDGKCRHDARRALVVHRAAPNTNRSPLVTQDIASRGPSSAVAVKLFHMSMPQVFLTPCSDPTTRTTSIPQVYTRCLLRANRWFIHSHKEYSPEKKCSIRKKQPQQVPVGALQLEASPLQPALSLPRSSPQCKLTPKQHPPAAIRG